MVTIAVTAERDGEPRVAVSPETAKKLTALGATEPSAGSDLLGMKSRAVRKGDRWILSGEKAWVTNVEGGKVFIVFAVMYVLMRTGLVKFGYRRR